ncbi:hypothetical protein ENKNEFLB_02626 [Nocardioides aquaticus]|uniref:Uncharacterized protein n=1 Tax=Nocardioides aquaticus TaxID=160826 RepID=A0ABX8EI96_9ACTN|nr:hypothetical protein ENKNEFLB_02626 [Nocardioides aquaticus]
MLRVRSDVLFGRQLHVAHLHRILRGKVQGLLLERPARQQ